MKHRLSSLQSWTESRGSRLAATLGLAFGLALLLLLLPITAGTVVQVPVPALPDETAALPQTTTGGWYTGDVIEVAAPFGAKTTQAAGQLQIVRTVNLTTANQVGFDTGILDDGQLVYRFTITNTTGTAYGGPISLTTNLPAGSVCLNIGNGTATKWLGDQAKCSDQNIAEWLVPAGFNVLPNETVVLTLAVAPNTANQTTLTAQPIVLVDSNPGDGIDISETFIGNGTGTAITTVVNAPTMVLTKTTAATVELSGQVVYTLSLRNTTGYTMNPDAFLVAAGSNKVISIVEVLPNDNGVIIPSLSGISATLLQNTFIGGPTGKQYVGRTIIELPTVTFVISNPYVLIPPGGRLEDGASWPNRPVGPFAIPSLAITYTINDASSLTDPPYASGYPLVNDNYYQTGPAGNVHTPTTGVAANTYLIRDVTMWVTKSNSTPSVNAGDLFSYTIDFRTTGGGMLGFEIIDYLPLGPTSDNPFGFRGARIDTTPAVTAGAISVEALTGTLDGSTVNTVTFKALPGVILGNNTTGRAVITVAAPEYSEPNFKAINQLLIAPTARTFITGSGNYFAVPNSSLTYAARISPGNYYAVATETVVSAVNNILIAKTVETTRGGGIAGYNEQLTYIIVFTNTSPNGIAKIEFSDTLTHGLAFVKSPPPRGPFFELNDGTKGDGVVINNTPPFTFYQIDAGDNLVITDGTRLEYRTFKVSARVITDSPAFYKYVNATQTITVSGNVFNDFGEDNPAIAAPVYIVNQNITVVKEATTTLGGTTGNVNSSLKDISDTVSLNADVDYLYVITNLGTISYNAVEIFDDRIHTEPTKILTDITSLGGVQTITLRYKVSGAHAIESPQNEYRITNTVIITPIPGNPQLAAIPAVTFTAQTSIPVGISNTISLTKVAFYSPTAHAVLTYPTAFDTVTYVYTVTNNSPNQVQLLRLNDDKTGAVVGAFLEQVIIAPFDTARVNSKTILLSEEIVDVAISQVLTMPHIITETGTNDRVALLTNTATVTGVFLNSGVVVQAMAVETVPITYVQSITVEKVAIPGTTISATAPYSTISYQYIITNSGSVTQVISPGGLLDWHQSLTSTSVVSYVAYSNPTAITISPGASDTSQIFNYTVSETDVLSGFNANLGRISFLTNTVEITAHPVTGTFSLYPYLTTLITSPDSGAGHGEAVFGKNRFSATISTALIFTPDLRITKRALVTEVGLSEAVEYEFTIENIGNMTLRYISGTDFITGSGPAGPITQALVLSRGLAITLAPGAQVVTSSFFTVDAATFADFQNATPKILTDSGRFTGYVVGQFDAGQFGSAITYVVTDSNEVTVTIVATGAIIVEKSVVPASAKLGDSIRYIYTVTNITTEDPVSDVVIYDNQFQYLDLDGQEGKNPLYVGPITIPYGSFGSVTDTFTTGSTILRPGLRVVFSTTTLFAANEDLIFQAMRDSVTGSLTPQAVQLNNVAYATGTLSSTVSAVTVVITSNLQTATLTLNYSMGMTMSKEVLNLDKPIQTSTPITAGVGDRLLYTYTVYNTGSLGFVNLFLADQTLLDGEQVLFSSNNPTLSPTLLAGQKYVYTNIVTVDANLYASIEKFAGSILTNTARVVATPTLYQRDSLGGFVTATLLGIVPQTDTATQTVLLTAPTDILVKKLVTWSGSSTMAATVGDFVTYTYVVTNNGTVDFGQVDGGIDLEDDKLGLITPTILPGGRLQPGRAITFRRSITLTPNMLIAEYNRFPQGFLQNVVTATGFFAGAFGDSTQAFTIAQLPLTYTIDLTVTKSVTWPASFTTPLGIGTPVTYIYVIEHVGPITQVSLWDVFGNGFTANQKSALTLSNSGVTTEFFQTSVLPNYMNLDPNSPDQQTITNMVQVMAVDPIGIFSDTVATDTASLDVLRDLNLEVKKVADRTSVPIGEDVIYSFILTNTGKVSLTVDLQDRILQTARVSSTLIVTTGEVIEPNQTRTFTFALTAVDADVTVNSAMITNVGVALASPVGLSPTIQIPFSSNLDATNTPVPVTVTVLFTPQLNVVKDIANPASGIARIDDVVTYTILVANVGNVTVRDIIFADPLLEVSRGTDLDIPPGGVPAQFVVSQTITQQKFEQLANLGDSKITNTAFVTGFAGGSVFSFTSNPEVLTIRSGASLDVDKSVTPGELTTLPGAVTYTYILTNNGTVTLTNIELVDDKLGVIATGLALARDEITTFVVPATITDPDPTGFLVNVVTASTTFTGTGIVSDNATAVVRTPVSAVFTITVNVNPNPVTLGTPQVFMVTVPDGVTITQFTWNLGNGVITTTTEPVLTYTYLTTETFNVTVTAVDENNDTAIATTTATVLPEAPFDVVKSADPASGTEVQPDSTITYTVMLTNMGTETATNVSIEDVLPTGVTFVDSDNFVNNNGTLVYSIAGGLLPGGSQMGVITVTVNADAVGTLENSAIALSDLGAKVSNVVTHTLPPAPRLHISKTDTVVERTGTTTAGNPVIAVGDRISYTITVSNDGTADANNVVITDVLTDSLDFVSATAPVVSNTVQADGTTLVTMTFASLPPQAQDIVVTLVVEVNADGEGRTIVTNQASVDSNETDPVSSDLLSTQPDLTDPTEPIVVKRQPIGIYLPIILRQPTGDTPTPTATPTVTPTPTATPPGQPDLTSEIIIEPASPGANDPVVVKVIVRNVGSVPVTEGFWVDFYINPQQQPSVARRWDDPTLLSTLPDPLGTQGIAWKVEPTDLQAIGGSLLPNSGNELVLVSRPFGDSANGSNEVGYRSNTVWHGRFVPGTTNLYSYADSYDEGGNDRGVIEELVDGAFVNNGDQMTAPEFGPLGDPLDMAPVPPPAMPPRSNP